MSTEHEHVKQFVEVVPSDIQIRLQQWCRFAFGGGPIVQIIDNQEHIAGIRPAIPVDIDVGWWAWHEKSLGHSSIWPYTLRKWIPHRASRAIALVTRSFTKMSRS